MKTTITLDETEIAEAVKMYVNKGGAGRGMNVIGNICVKVSGESLSSATVHAQVDVEPKKRKEKA